MNTDHVKFDDSVRVSSAGFIHLRILTERLSIYMGFCRQLRFSTKTSRLASLIRY